jgi:hypothetical protein
VSWRHDPASRVRLWRDGAEMVLAIPRIRRHLSEVPAATAVPARASAGASRGTIFQDDNAASLAAADSTHWWFRSKAAFVASAIRRSGPPDDWLVDVGGGSAGVTSLLGWAPSRTLVVEGSGSW